MEEKNKEKDEKIICLSILENILLDIYSFYSQKIAEKTTNKQIKNLCQIFKENKIETIKEIKFKKDEKEEKEHCLYHVSVLHQYIPNFCGYHALFNLMEACKLIKYSEKKERIEFNDAVS